MGNRPRSLFVLATIVAAASPLTAQLKGGFYENETLGFRVGVPSKWEEVPLKVEEDWIVAKFLSDRSYVTSGKDFSMDHKPLMKIVVFTDDAKKIKRPEMEKIGANTFFIRDGSVPYQNYRDYLKRNLRGEGFFFSEEKQDKVSGVDCMQYEVKLEKREWLKRRLVTWVFKGEGMDVAVEFEVLEDRYDNLIGQVRNSLRSFRFVERKESDVATSDDAAAPAKKQPTSALWTKSRKEWRKLPAEQRLEQRKQIEQNRFEAVKARTPQDWTISRSDHFLVISHADPRFTKTCVDAAEVFHDWLEKTFGDLTDEYVRHGVLRVCKDWDEYEAYRFKGSNEARGFSVSDNREAVTYRDNYNGTSGRDVGYFLDDIFATYLYDKDPLVYGYMPAWLSWGLSRYVARAQVKGRKITFDPDDWEKEEIRELIRGDKLHDLKTLMSLDYDQYWSMYKSERRTDSELCSVVRFILGPGRRHPRLKNFLPNYLKAVIEVGEEFDEKEGVVHKEATTEEEEEQQAKQVDSKLKERRKAIAAKLNARMTGDWTDKDWQSLQRAYEKAIK